MNMAESNINFKKEGAIEILNYLRDETENIKDIFDEVEFMMESINGDDEIWKGQSQESFYDSFKTISAKFTGIGDDIDRQNDFLEGVINNYEERDNHINKNAEEKASDLNIN